MFVMGIDPGLTRCGYGGIQLTASSPKAVTAGVITTEQDSKLPERLRLLAAELRALLNEYKPDAVAVERVFFQTNVRTAMGVGQASGLALVAASEFGCEVAEYTANEVKMAVTGYGSAGKEQVQRVVQMTLGLAQPPRPPDAADALAIALCHSTLAGRRLRHTSVSGQVR